MTSCFAVVQTLTPLTLELGGKSPAFVDAGHDTWNGINNRSLELFLEEATEAPFTKIAMFAAWFEQTNRRGVTALSHFACCGPPFD